MLHLHRRGRYYHAWGRVGGRLIRKSLATTSLAVAEKRLRVLEDQLWSGKVEADTDWPAFAEEFSNTLKPPYLKESTATKYQFVLDRFSRFVESRGIIDLSAITPAIIQDYVSDRERDTHPFRGHRIGPEGIKADLRILRRVFSYAIERGYIERNPVKGPLNSKPADTQPFSKDEIARMLEVCQSRDRRGGPLDLSAIVLFFLNTGLRISDVIHFTKRGVRGEWIRVTTRKRDRPVQIPLHPATATALATYRQAQNEMQAGSPYLFSTATGKPVENLDAYLRRLWAKAGIEKAHAHRFRDTFAVSLLEKGASLYDVSRLLGITTAVAEKHYAPYVKELRERGQKLVASLEFRSQNVHTVSALQ